MGDLKETICALSSAPGRAGIAVVRMSGSDCFSILKQLICADKELDSYPARQAILGKVLDPRGGTALDQALVTRFPGPHSYTGEDVAEISIHGSPVLVTALLESLCAAGARLAEPGEFTLRAFLQGRMDLTQAEAVRDIIESTTLYQARLAARQHFGLLARELKPIKEALIDVIVQLESAVEFVEEDLALESRAALCENLEHIEVELERWVDSYRRGKIIHDGFSMAIVGSPNVGKSSLFNVLLAQERSIVTEIPGTTRDLISELANFEGIPVRLLDTAGIQDSDDRVEQLGVTRSYCAMADADAILHVLDMSRPPAMEDGLVQERLADLSCIVVMNKVDLPVVWTQEQEDEYRGNRICVEVSAKTRSGITDLRLAIKRHLFGDEGPEQDGVLVTNLRQCLCLERTKDHLKRAMEAMRSGLSEEFVLLDLHAGMKQLGAITGETNVEDILAEIFSRFCIGK